MTDQSSICASQWRATCLEKMKGFILHKLDLLYIIWISSAQLGFIIQNLDLFCTTWIYYTKLGFILHNLDSAKRPHLRIYTGACALKATGSPPFSSMASPHIPSRAPRPRNVRGPLPHQCYIPRGWMPTAMIATHAITNRNRSGLLYIRQSNLAAIWSFVTHCSVLTKFVRRTKSSRVSPHNMLK